MRFLNLLAGILILLGCEQTPFDPTPLHPDEASLFIDSVNQHFYEIYSRDFEEAKNLTAHAVNLATKNNLYTRKAKALHNHAVVLYLMGYYDKSLEAALNSYELFDSLEDASGQARLCNDLGNFYRKQGQEEKALAMWIKAEKLALASGDMEALGTSNGMRGTFYWLQEDFETSDMFYIKCYKIRVSEQDSVGLGYVLIDLADMEQRKGNLEAAIDYFKQSNQIREDIRDYQGLVDNYKMMGDLWMKEKSYAEAIPYYLTCADQSKQFKYPDLERKSYDSLASAYALMNNFKAAYQYQEKAGFLEDSLFSADKAKVISELQTKYETAKKEKELIEKNLIIKRRNILIIGLGIGFTLLLIIGLQIGQRQKLKHQKALETEQRMAKEAEIAAAISSQEKERTRFAKDLHDGFGQMISILNLNLKSLEDGAKNKHEVFESSSQVLEDMYRELKGICFNLMPQTLIKHGITAALKEFASRINLTNQLLVETDFFGLEERLTDVQEISLYRIAQEWVNNVIKYSDADKVMIQITRDEEEITLLIEDNGTGFDEDLLKSGKGNGWKNMNSRANLINGELELDTTPGIKGNTLIVNAIEKRELVTH
ncbi:MAG: tetratricopeptide repeat protein [Marinoscillum sp.]